MMAIDALDLVIRFDKAKGSVLLLVPKSPGQTDVLKLFYEIPVPEVVSVSDFADEVGVAVASFLHARHGERFVANESEDDEDEEVQEDDFFADARLLIDRLGDFSTIEDLEGIELLLKRANDFGDEDAGRYLKKTWPALKNVFFKRIQKK